jgi:GAF domain-containing protein
VRDSSDFLGNPEALRALIAHLPGSAVFVLDARLCFRMAAGGAVREVGFDPEQVVGRTLHEALGLDLARAYEPHVRAALAGKTFTVYLERDDREFVLRGAPLNDGAGRPPVALVLVHDITADQGSERARRLLRDRQAFLFVLTERLRALEDPEEIQRVAVSALGEHLGASRAGYAHDEGDGEWVHVTSNYTDGVPSLEGRYRYQDYGQELLSQLRAGRTVVRYDSAHDPTLSAAHKAAHAAAQSGATVNVPLVKGGRLVALLFVHQQVPRAWSGNEVELMEAVADQTWAAVERARVESALHRERLRAQLALDAAAMGSFVWLAEEDRAESDDRMLAMFGLAPDSTLTLADALGRLIHEDDRERYGAAVARALDPAGDGELHESIRVCRPDGTMGWVTILGRTSFQGYPRRAITISGAAIDITEQKEAELLAREREAGERLEHQRTELLADVIAELDALDSVRGRLQRLVEVLVPRVADSGFVELRNERGDPTRIAARGAPAAAGPSASTIRVALAVREQPFATLVLGLDSSRDPVFASPTFLEAFRARVAVNLTAGALREEEHGIALGLQRALLPNRVVQHSDVDIAARYEAGSDALEVGGDWYDSFDLPDGSIGLCVGDVVGHGLEAAAAMGRLRVALATLAAHEPDPGRVLTQLEAIAAGPNGVGYLTVCYAILDPGTHQLRYASAGHPPMLVVSPAGDARWLDDASSSPLSGWRGEPRSQASTVLAPGSLLVLYSDGLIERRTEAIDQGLERLAVAAAGLTEVPVQNACDRLIEELGVSQRRADDVVVVCVRPH